MRLQAVLDKPRHCLHHVGMTLSDYIRTVGEPAAAQLFGVSIHTIKAWRYGWRTPKPANARQIVKATGRRVSLASIYSGATATADANPSRALGDDTRKRDTTAGA